MKLTFTEIVVLLLLLVMTVPAVCRKTGRPAMAYGVYLICGMLLSPLLEGEIRQAMHTVGEIGFVLMLFEIGLEIDLPKWKAIGKPFRRALVWTVLQWPILLVAARGCGLSLAESFIAAAGLCGCSVGIAFSGWYHYKAENSEAKASLLYWMIIIEIGAMILLTAGGPALTSGLTLNLLVTIGGITMTIILIAVFGDKLAQRVAFFSRSTLRWRAHFWILFVLVVVSLGRRLGLPPPKTAFFLGLAISRTTHEGLALEHHLRPIGQNLLIPVFFLSLGATISPDAWYSCMGCCAVLTAVLLILLRRLIARPVLGQGSGPHPHLLASPNLTIAAVAAEIMGQAGAPASHIAWLLMTSTLMTLYAVRALPARVLPARLGRTP